jgi:chromosome segregation ATPase
MIGNHRTAFPNKPNDALEHNLDKIVNMAAMKLKEFINKKQDLMRTNSLLKGQKAVLESDITHYEKETTEKAEQVNKMQEEFAQVQKEIEELDVEYKTVHNDFNTKNENLKATVNVVNDELNNMEISNGIEETSKKSELRKEYENYLAMKNVNKLLMEKMYEARRELYYLEVRIKINLYSLFLLYIR